MIGELLVPAISKFKPVLARNTPHSRCVVRVNKITGMLLALDIRELGGLLASDQLLRSTVEDAIPLLDQTNLEAM